LGTNSAFAQGPRKTTETLIESAGRKTFRMQAIQQSGIKYANPNGIPYLAVALVKKVYIFVLQPAP
jgi:hypothetical protein